MNSKNEIQQNSPSSRKLESIKRDNMGNFTVLMVFLYFTSLFISLQFFQIVDLSLYAFFRLNLLFIGVSFLIPIYFYRKKLSMSFYEYTLINILSIGPFLCTLCLIFNFIFSGNSYVESYAIVEKKREGSNVVLTLEGNHYSDKEYLRTISDFESAGSIGGAKQLHIQFSDGLFGIRIIEEKRLNN